MRFNDLPIPHYYLPIPINRLDNRFRYKSSSWQRLRYSLLLLFYRSNISIFKNHSPKMGKDHHEHRLPWKGKDLHEHRCCLNSLNMTMLT
ncbi:hypothetical protein M8J76_016680 [Diaphorina citri]|nr:hypothetical protein M8J76_016680 [Diaphorina citri]